MMSRTNHGGKDPSFEYWSRRPFNRCGQLPGRFAKRRTHKAERQMEQQDVDLGIRELSETEQEAAAREAEALRELEEWEASQ